MQKKRTTLLVPTFGISCSVFDFLPGAHGRWRVHREKKRRSVATQKRRHRSVSFHPGEHEPAAPWRTDRGGSAAALRAVADPGSSDRWSVR